MNFKRIISCIAIWIMFLATVISYFMFISGEEYGNFELFYWSVVSITFANGFSSCFAFAVNSNSIMYAFGISIFSFVTFFLQKIYKHFYHKYNWDNYDYNLVIVQYSFVIFSILLTCTLWTVDQLNEMNNESKGNYSLAGHTPRLTWRGDIEIDLSLTPIQDGPNNGAHYRTGDKEFTVIKQDADDNIVPSGYVRYEHRSFNNQPFSSAFVKYNNKVDPLWTEQSENYTSVYAYYRDNADHNDQPPLIICLKTIRSDFKYYKREQTWNKDDTINGVNPESPSNKLKDIKDGTYNAGAGGKIIKVTNIRGNNTSNNNVPLNYVRYKHSIDGDAQFKLGLVKHNGVQLTLIPTPPTSVTAVYVYYHSTGDPNHEFPLIVCVDTGSDTRKYYKRGNEWKEEQSLSSVDPDTTDAGGLKTLQGKLDALKVMYEVNLNITGDKYNANAFGQKIKVEKTQDDKVPNGYTRYEHKPWNTSTTIFNLGLVKHNDIPLNGIKQYGQQVTSVYVYYKKTDRDHEFPLIVCADTGNDQTRKYYKRGNKWNGNDEGLNKINPDAEGMSNSKLEKELENLDKSHKLKDTYEINIKEVPDTGRNNKDYKAGAEGLITVTTTLGDDKKVPRDYIRYDHKPKDTNVTSFNLTCIKHGDIILNGLYYGIEVQSVYVYYETKDTKHEFPLIVCIKTPIYTYYKRMNKWAKIISVISLGPEDYGFSFHIQSHLYQLIEGYEIKLEWSDTVNRYTATLKNDTINVTPVIDSSGYSAYKCFKHNIPQNQKINRITIHGQVTNGINNADFEQIEFQPNGGVFVYFSEDDRNNERPLLICLSKDGTNSNTWFKPKNEAFFYRYTWKQDTNTFNSKNPKNISDLATNLTAIKQALNTPPGTDTGYTERKFISQLNYVLKLDYIPKDTGNGKAIKYIRSNNNGGNDKAFVVERKDNTTDGIPQGYFRYEHKPKENSTTQFKLGSLMYGDYYLNGIGEYGQHVQSVYVYYSTGDPRHQFPLIVCIKISNTVRKYYIRGQTWSDAGTELNEIDPDTANAGEARGPLENALEGLKDKYEIDIGKTDAETGYKASVMGDQITVNKGTASKVLVGYHIYEHKIENGAQFTLCSVINGDYYLNGIQETNNVMAVYVYYSTSDTDHQFPLIVCVKISPSVRKYYTRGQTWDEDADLQGVNPDSASAANKLQTTLDTLKDIHEIRLEFTNTLDNGNYKSSATGTTISVTVKDSTNSNKVPQGYVAFTHEGSVTGTVKFNHNGIELKGLPTSGVNIDNSNKLWVYYQERDSQPDINMPLLIYVYKDNSDTWYHRGLTWKKTDQIIGNPNNSQINLASSIEKLFKGKLERQGTFKELIYSDNYYHWSPILMLSLSLATAYAFHPIITPHSLIDTERDEIMDLSIMILSLIPNFVLVILDNIQGDHGPSGKWDEGRWFYNYIWLIACIPYLICIFTLTFIFRYPNNWICSYIKGNPYALGFFSITINTSLKLMVSTAFGGGAQQSVGGFIGSLSQFNILLMLLLRLLITLFCDGYFNTLSLAEDNSQPFTHNVYSPWSPLLLTNPPHVQQVPRIDHSNYPELIPGL